MCKLLGIYAALASIDARGRSKMFRPLPLILTTVVLAGSTFTPADPARAQFNDAAKQAQCELSAIRDTRSPLAIQLIHSACNWLAIDSGLLNANNRKYHMCILQYLSGVQDDAAAGAVVSACRVSYPP